MELGRTHTYAHTHTCTHADTCRHTCTHTDMCIQHMRTLLLMRGGVVLAVLQHRTRRRMQCWVESGLGLAAPVQRRCQTLRRREAVVTVTLTPVAVTMVTRTKRCCQRARAPRLAACRDCCSVASSLAPSSQSSAPSSPSRWCGGVAHAHWRQSLVQWMRLDHRVAALPLSRHGGPVTPWTTVTPVESPMLAASLCMTWA